VFSDLYSRADSLNSMSSQWNCLNSQGWRNVFAPAISNSVVCDSILHARRRRNHAVDNAGQQCIAVVQGWRYIQMLRLYDTVFIASTESTQTTRQISGAAADTVVRQSTHNADSCRRADMVGQLTVVHHSQGLALYPRLSTDNCTQDQNVVDLSCERCHSTWGGGAQCFRLVYTRVSRFLLVSLEAIKTLIHWMQVNKI